MMVDLKSFVQTLCCDVSLYGATWQVNVENIVTAAKEKSVDSKGKHQKEILPRMTMS